MKNDNSSYTVTPPDLFLSENGVNALIVSTDDNLIDCLLYTSPSPRDRQKSRMPSSA